MQDKDIEFISVLPQQSIMYPFHPGLSCFREPDEQHEYLQDSLLNQPVQISLAIHNGKVIGYANLVPPEQDERWGTLPYVVMMGALEVAPAYRQQKVAHRILQHLFSHATTIEHQIVLALEYYWHWDIKSIFQKEKKEYTRFLYLQINQKDKRRCILTNIAEKY